MNKLISFLMISLLMGCASSPVLYPNNKYKSVGEEVADSDIDKCMESSDKFLKSKKAKKILKSAGKGSIVGGVVGAVSGLFSGDVVESLAQGAAIGAAAGGASGAISKDQLKEAYVNRCLQRKGYEVIGWE